MCNNGNMTNQTSMLILVEMRDYVKILDYTRQTNPEISLIHWKISQ